MARAKFMGWLDDERKAREKAAKAAQRWGVFAWDPTNMYREAQALRIYKREGAAQAHADKVNAELGQGANFVVRSIR